MKSFMSTAILTMLACISCIDALGVYSGAGAPIFMRTYPSLQKRSSSHFPSLAALSNGPAAWSESPAIPQFASSQQIHSITKNAINHNSIYEAEFSSQAVRNSAVGAQFKESSEDRLYSGIFNNARGASDEAKQDIDKTLHAGLVEVQGIVSQNAFRSSESAPENSRFFMPARPMAVSGYFSLDSGIQDLKDQDLKVDMSPGPGVGKHSDEIDFINSKTAQNGDDDEDDDEETTREKDGFDDFIEDW